jgi:excinuclease ABC subunit B
MKFELKSEFGPTGDQPQAIKELAQGVELGVGYQTLLGVTGSGKTFTIANVIQKVQRPTLILSHNKTLAAQLYGEFKSFFPDNAVEYFVSYYDYFQPEAYLPHTDTYIEKDLAINDELEKLRLSTTSALLSGRKDVIVVSSVSCLYGMGNPDDFHSTMITVKRGAAMSMNYLARKLVEALYVRNEISLEHGKFRIKGDTIDVHLAYADHIVRIHFWGDEIDEIETIDPLNNIRIESHEEINIFPANLFVTTQERINRAVNEIQDDLGTQVEYFQSLGKVFEAKRLYERVNYDLEMIKELGHCSGIENYSRYFDGRKPGTRPFCLLDFFPKDFLLVVDESHVTIPQIHAMYGGDFSRKNTLVNYGFRLPSALDNRPLKFEEFEELTHQTIYVSATPAEYELARSGGVFVEQVIRPTGLLDPIIEVRPSANQIDDLLEEIHQRVELDERVLVTTLTKRMAEELQAYLEKMGVRSSYIHSDVETLERVKIMEDLRNGLFDVLVGVNLLREGLDLPQVSLVAIIDADKEGMLRSHRALTQTAGRAARNVNGKVIMYADKITKSMRLTIDETNRRREKQMNYNIQHNITPKTAIKNSKSILPQSHEKLEREALEYKIKQTPQVAAEPYVETYRSAAELEAVIEKMKKKMKECAKKLEFIEAAQYRDEIIRLETLLKEM